MPTNDPMNAVRAELAQRREDLGLTYEQAGARAGITGQWWRNLESGTQRKGGVDLPVNISRTRLIKMAKALGWSPRQALECAGMAPLVARELSQVINDPRQELVRLLPLLSEPRVWALLYVARTMRDPNASLTEAPRTIDPDPGTHQTDEVWETPQGPNVANGNDWGIIQPS